MRYQTSIIGIGTDDDPRRPKVANYATDRWVMLQDNGDTAIVEVEAGSDALAEIQADTEIVGA